MESKDVGLTDYFSAFRRRRRLALGLGVPIFAVAAILAIALPSVYRSVAVFKLKDASGNQGFQGRGPDSYDAYADRYVTGLTQLVLRHDSLKTVFDTVPLPAGMTQGEAMKQLADKIRAEMVTEKILDPENGRERVINSGFSVSVENRDPDFAFRGAKWAADAFIRASREYALTESKSQSAFYAAEADRVRAKIADLEAKLADFKKQNFDQLPETAQANLNVRNQVEQELTSNAREITTLQQNRIFAEQQLSQAQMTNTGASLATLQAEYDTKALTYSPDHPDMIALRHQIAALKHGGPVGTDNSLKSQLQSQEAVLAETRQRYSEDHPDVKLLIKSIAQLKARIAAGEKADTSDADSSPMVSQLRVQIHSLDTQISALQARDGELRAQRTRLESHMASTPEVERNYQAISRDLGTAHAQYDQLITHRQEADVKSASIISGESDKFSLVQPPVLPDKPAKPSRIAIAMLGLIGALVVAVMGTLMAEAMDPTVRGARDIRAALNESPLSVIPKIKNTVSKRKQSRQAMAAVTSLVAGIPLLYLLIRLVVR